MLRCYKVGLHIIGSLLASVCVTRGGCQIPHPSCCSHRHQPPVIHGDNVTRMGVTRCWSSAMYILLFRNIEKAEILSYLQRGSPLKARAGNVLLENCDGHKYFNSDIWIFTFYKVLKLRTTFFVVVIFFLFQHE